jgi:CotS family spore coat protein
MAELPAIVYRNFGLRVNRVKRERSYYICETPDGLKKIAKTSDSAEHLWFQHTVKEHLYAKGYPWVDRFALSETGQPFVLLGTDYFVLTPYIDGRETDFGDWADVEQALTAAARFHVCARHVPSENEPPPPPPLTDYFRKQAAELNAVAKRVRRQARLSDFDVLFIKNIHFYTEQMRQAIAALDATDYPLWLSEALSQRHICHNMLKEESLNFNDGHVFITHWGDAGPDLQLSDLGSLIRRHIQRAGRHAAPLPLVLDVYGHITPLSGDALAILYALLLFPWQFMKIVGMHYNKKRSWTPNAMTNRMYAVVAEKDEYMRYINVLNREV